MSRLSKNQNLYSKDYLYALTRNAMSSYPMMGSSEDQYCVLLSRTGAALAAGKQVDAITPLS